MRIYPPITRIISITLIIVFIGQDIVWAYPEYFAHRPQAANKLAPNTFFKEPLSQTRAGGLFIETLIENNPVFRRKITLAGIEHILNLPETQKWCSGNDIAVQYMRGENGIASEILIYLPSPTSCIIRYYDPTLLSRFKYEYLDPIGAQDFEHISKQILGVNLKTIAVDSKGRIQFDGRRPIVGTKFAGGKVTLIPYKNNGGLAGFEVYFEKTKIGFYDLSIKSYKSLLETRRVSGDGRLEFDNVRYHVGETYAGKEVTLVPLADNDWSVGWKITYEGEKLATFYAAGGKFVRNVQKTRKVSGEGRTEFDGVRYYVGEDYAGKEVTFVPLVDDDWSGGWRIICEGKEVAKFDANAAMAEQFTRTPPEFVRRKVDDKGRVLYEGKRYSVGMRHSGKEVIIKPQGGEDWSGDISIFYEGEQLPSRIPKARDKANRTVTINTDRNGEFTYNNGKYGLGKTYANKTITLEFAAKQSDWSAGCDVLYEGHSMGYYEVVPPYGAKKLVKKGRVGESLQSVASEITESSPEDTGRASSSGASTPKVRSARKSGETNEAAPEDMGRLNAMLRTIATNLVAEIASGDYDKASRSMMILRLNIPKFNEMVRKFNSEHGPRYMPIEVDDDLRDISYWEKYWESRMGKGQPLLMPAVTVSEKPAVKAVSKDAAELSEGEVTRLYGKVREGVIGKLPDGILTRDGVVSEVNKRYARYILRYFCENIYRREGEKTEEAYRRIVKSITKEDLHSKGLARLLADTYKDSPSLAIMDILTNYPAPKVREKFSNLRHYHFKSVPQGYWNGKDGIGHAREAMGELLSLVYGQEGIEGLAKWCAMSKNLFMKKKTLYGNGLMGMVANVPAYNKRTTDALSDFFENLTDETSDELFGGRSAEEMRSAVHIFKKMRRKAGDYPQSGVQQASESAPQGSIRASASGKANPFVPFIRSVAETLLAASLVFSALSALPSNVSLMVSEAAAAPVTQEIIPGVGYISGGRVYSIQVDPGVKGLSIKEALVNNKIGLKARLSDIVKSAKGVGGIPGSYFIMGVHGNYQPIGVIVIDGKIGEAQKRRFCDDGR